MATEKNNLLQDAISLARSAHSGLEELVKEWKQVTETPSSGRADSNKFVMVARSDIERLVTEVMQMKEFLPKVLDNRYLQAQQKLINTEQELQRVKKEKDKLADENEHLQQRSEVLTVNYEKEKQENFAMKCQVNEMAQQLSQQADYCSSMGSACCSLLWRVSQQEQAVEAMLAKSNVGEFLELVGSTLQSYLATYNDELPDENSEETQFILSLCGTVTNMAASAYGRDYLAKKPEGQSLIDLYCTTLSEAPTGPACAKLRNFLLMTLYNISLNQSGLQVISSKPNLLGVLSWLLQGRYINGVCMHVCVSSVVRVCSVV
ncbi:heat shock factor 2-binding protein-like isoform X1 [Dysidea avara]|uniref:heat shock factor 2-binding protein-like isoform X1 n=1 Tax=Dysidea avara TaxID=196820 RepID=UPI0033213ECB